MCKGSIKHKVDILAVRNHEKITWSWNHISLIASFGLTTKTKGTKIEVFNNKKEHLGTIHKMDIVPFLRSLGIMIKFNMNDKNKKQVNIFDNK